MKKIAAALMVAFFAASGMFALETNLETGFTFGGAAREIENEGYISKDKEKLSTSLAGIYFAGDFELNEFFGLFADLSFNGGFDTTYEKTRSLTGSFNWGEPNYKVTSFGSLLLGADYILHLGDSIKLKLGGGLDFAVAESKANGLYVDPSTLLVANTIDFEYADWTKKSALIGLGSKAKVNFNINKRFGFNAGLVIDWYFLTLSEKKDKNPAFIKFVINTVTPNLGNLAMFAADKSSEVLLENTFAIRPEFGVTFRFGVED